MSQNFKNSQHAIRQISASVVAEHKTSWTGQIECESICAMKISRNTVSSGVEPGNEAVFMIAVVQYSPILFADTIS